MNLQQYAHELRQEYNLPNQCQFCGEYVDKLDLCHIVPRSKANAKILMKKLGVTKTQAYTLLDCYGLNTIFGCAKCNGREIGGGKTCKTDDITIFTKNHMDITSDCISKLYDLDQNNNNIPCFLDLYNEEASDEQFFEEIEESQRDFQKLFYQG